MSSSNLSLRGLFDFTDGDMINFREMVEQDNSGRQRLESNQTANETTTGFRQGFGPANMKLFLLLSNCEMSHRLYGKIFLHFLTLFP